MKITVECHYRYAYHPANDRPCVAILEVRLPAGERGAIPEPLVSNRVLLGEPLHAQWGTLDGNYRARTLAQTCVTWREADRWISQTIDNVNYTVGLCIDEYNNVTKMMPKDGTVKSDFDLR